MKQVKLMNDLCDVINKYVSEIKLAELIGVLETLKIDLIQQNFKATEAEYGIKDKNNV